MADDLRIKLNRAAIRDQLLKSPEIMSICSEYARQIASRCGNGYVIDTHTGRNRVNAMVYADTYAAKRDNMKNNTLLKATR